ncbi:MafI family immunity protein [Dysgonomonas macrotermitis]|uniref:MafI family immunity protein n=1 Tax=Dysgonomonas macrotermitis TaxID=1346286 RepID=A0A1M4Y504_9BACT|nr:MafI family immunity protein [Dysgonomonas macrotermitis]SHF00788.1 hypothetical protein SAMN05444362_10374 [Dysgonomonas macrotermitis]
MQQDLIKLISDAKKLGLNQELINCALEYLEHKEYGLALDTILEQLYEYDITIDKSFHELANSILDKMNQDKNTYSYLEKLCK